MPPDQRDAAHLLDMLRAAQKVHKYARGKGLEDFETDELLRDAVERNIEIIGEAARRVSDEYKCHHPDIPWRKIIAQRNVLIHQYDSISIQEMWDVISIYVPRLIDALNPLIPPPPQMEP